MTRGSERRALFARGQQLARKARQTLDEQHAAAESVRVRVGRLREAQVTAALDEIPVASLNDVTEGRLRVGMLETAGCASGSTTCKERLFDAYARRGDAAESSPDAVDVADTGLAHQIIEEEQQRLAVLARDDAPSDHLI